SFGGTISGSGGLTKVGSGSLSLGGTNTFTGGINVLGGSLFGNTSSLVGNILNNGIVVFDQGSNGTYAGSMTGTRSLTKLGAGTLTLTGINTYSGGTLISAGGLIGTTSSLQGFIVNNGALTFDQATNGIFSGIISGIGTVTKLGSGNVTFTGLN